MRASGSDQRLGLDDPLFELLFASSPGGAMVLGPDGSVLAVNPAWQRVSGMTLDSLREYNVLTDERLRRTGVMPLLARAFRGERVVLPDAYFARPDRGPDGVAPSVPGVLEPLVDPEGTLRAVLVLEQEVEGPERELRASEERYRYLFENSPISLREEDFSEVKAMIDGIRAEGVTDLRAYFEAHPEAVAECAARVRVVQVNRATVETNEAASEAELLVGLAPIFTEETYPMFREELVTLAEGQTAFVGETVGTTLRGRRVHYEIKVTVPPGYEDTWARVLVSGIDITDRKNAEEALRSSERRFSVAFDSSPVTLAISTLEVGEFVAVNTTALRTFGFTASEVVGQTAFELGMWVDPAARQRLFGGIEEGETRTGEVEFRMKNGEIRTHLVSVARFDSEGQAFLLSAGIDLTERKHAEGALRAAEAKYRTLVERLPLVTYAVRLDTGEAIYVSPQMEDVLGYPPDEFIVGRFAGRRGRAKIFHPDDRERVLAATEDAHARGEVFEGDYRMVAADGRTVWIRDQGAIVRDDDRRPLFAQGFLLDITSERETREEQAHLEDELRQAQKLEAIGRLAGGMAHDFNNLLTAIGGYSEFLIDALADDDERRADAEEIKRAADRATGLTRQLLAFGRRQVLERQSLDLNEVVSELGRLLRRLIGSDVELVTVLAPALGCVEADRSQLEQVIVNLALNARDAMPEGGKLVLETQNLTLEGPLLDQSPSLEPGDYVTLSVRDPGVGIDAETQARMFEPFFTTKDVGRGTGLGLSTVYGIVEQSGGRVYVYSEPGLGTTFKIYLPQSDLPAPAGEERPAEPTSLAGTETILLVEDEETLRQLAVRTLRSQGYTVLEAHYASEALELWQAHRDEIDLVVTDVVMPGLSGVELAERIAAEDSGMRIVLMSGYADPGAGERVPESNRAGFLEKPFTPNALLRTVREAVERA